MNHHSVDGSAVTALAQGEAVFDQENGGDRIQMQADADMDLLIQYMEGLVTDTRVHLSTETHDRLRDTLRAGHYSDETAYSVVRAINGIDDYLRYQEVEGRRTLMMSTLEDLPAAKLRKIYNVPIEEGYDNPLHLMFEKEAMDSEEALLSYAIVLEKCVGPKALVDEQTTNPHVQALLETYDHPSHILLDTIPNTIPAPEEYNPFLGDLYTKSEFLLRSAGFPQEMITQYIAPAVIRHKKETGYVDIFAFKKEMEEMVGQSVRIGESNIQKLYNTFRMENIWNYTNEDIDRLLLLINKDETVIEHLRSGDVTVYLTDIRGDYNQAMTNEVVKNAYAKDPDRTLRFELTRASDMYRHMIFLNRLNIYPSTLVFASHGAPGATGMGVGTDRIEFVTKRGQDGLQKENTNKQVQIDQTSIGRLVNEYMQVNKHGDLKNQKVVVVYSCSGDAQVEVEPGRFSSVAEDVALQAGKNSVVYAGDRPLFTSIENGNPRLVDHALYKSSGNIIKKSVTNELYAVDTVTADGQPTQRVVRMPVDELPLNTTGKRSA